MKLGKDQILKLGSVPEFKYSEKFLVFVKEKIDFHDSINSELIYPLNLIACYNYFLLEWVLMDLCQYIGTQINQTNFPWFQEYINDEYPFPKREILESLVEVERILCAERMEEVLEILLRVGQFYKIDAEDLMNYSGKIFIQEIPYLKRKIPEWLDKIQEMK